MSRRRFMPIWITPVLLGAAAAQQPQQKPPVTTPPSQALPPDEDAPPPTKSNAPAAQAAPPSQALPPDEDAPPPTKGKPPVSQTAPPWSKPSSPSSPSSDTDLPPDEDAVSAQQQYTFNPLKSKRSFEIGTEYFKKGNNKAAAERFRDATGWNEGNADAWRMLGEAEEKRGQTKTARSAYEKYLQLAGNAKSAAEVRKRLEKLK